MLAVIDAASWQEPELFRWLARAGKVARMEMYRTFNCGVGMVLCVPAARCDAAIAQLAAAGENAWRVVQVLVDPAGDNAWAIQASVQGADASNVDTPLLRLERIGI